jgi:hypothetical protein
MASVNRVKKEGFYIKKTNKDRNYRENDCLFFLEKLKKGYKIFNYYI